MTDQIFTEGNERQSMWTKFKTQLHFMTLALDYDPLEDTYERARSLNLEVECLKSRIKALELQNSAPAINLE